MNIFCKEIRARKPQNWIKEYLSKNCPESYHDIKETAEQCDKGRNRSFHDLKCMLETRFKRPFTNTELMEILKTYSETAFGILGENLAYTYLGYCPDIDAYVIFRIDYPGNIHNTVGNEHKDYAELDKTDSFNYCGKALIALVN